MNKKLIYILILFIFCTNSAFGEIRHAGVDYDGFQYTFKPGDEEIFLKNADKNFIMSEKAQTSAEKVFYLQEAMRYYFLLSKINPASLEAQIGLARIYDELNLDKYAKQYFFNAFNFNNKNPKTNLYFGDFHYKRGDLLAAVYFYKRAYQFGYSKDYKLNYKIGTIYEKLADIETAKIYYINAIKLEPKNTELANKIRLLDELNYGNSQYYLFRK